MPERYTITASSEQLEKAFQIEVSDLYLPKYNAGPAQLLPVITSSGIGGLSYFYWGTIPGWSNNKSISKKLLTAPADLILEKEGYKKAFLSKRCIIPADGYYAWKQVGKKTKIPYRVVLGSQSLFSFAGIWEEFEDEKDETHHIFRIVTVTANNLLNDLDDSMPLILEKDQYKKWLQMDSKTEDLVAMFKTYPEDKMFKYAVSSKLENTNYNDPDLIEKVTPMDQHGNYSLFG